MLVDQTVLFNNPVAYRAGSEEAAARCPGTTLCYAGGRGRDPGQDSLTLSSSKAGRAQSGRVGQPQLASTRIEHGTLLPNGLLHRLPSFLICPPAPLWFGKLRPRSVKPPPTLPDGSCHKQQMRTEGRGPEGQGLARASAGNAALPGSLFREPSLA